MKSLFNSVFVAASRVLIALTAIYTSQTASAETIYHYVYACNPTQSRSQHVFVTVTPSAGGGLASGSYSCYVGNASGSIANSTTYSFTYNAATGVWTPANYHILQAASSVNASPEILTVDVWYPYGQANKVYSRSIQKGGTLGNCNVTPQQPVPFSGDIEGAVTINFGTPVAATTDTSYKCNDHKSGGNQENCSTCSGVNAAASNVGMARYSVHSMLVSLNIQDTPLRYSPSRGPSIDFTVTYNQKESQQPATFAYSNLGPKWTFNWLSYVSDDPNAQLPLTGVYVPGGGAEIFAFNSASQTFTPDPQSHATLVKTGASSYERRLPDGSKQIFGLSDGAASYPRRIFMTQMVDPAGNAVTIGYDASFRVTTLTDADAVGQVTNLAYELAGDPLKITKVTDPFGRFATFQYENGKLKTITDPIGIQSQFTYVAGTDSIDSLTTPYGTTTFVSGGSGTNRWIEMTDPLGGKERVEYRDNAPGISATDPANTVPGGFTNAGLNTANTFYWDKKAMLIAPGDYTKAKITHWLYNADGSVSGIASSEKKPLENRVWYSYAGQSDYQHAGPSANPSKVARVLDDGTTQLSQYEYNSIGNMTKAIDPVGRVMSYIYDSNKIDLLETRQTKGANNELLRKLTYNALHKPLTDTDAAGQVTTYTYNPQGQILTVTNAKNETTTYGYGNGAPGRPLGYLVSITSPPVNGVSARRRFVYDSAFFGANAPKRIACRVDEPDNYVVEYRYDDLDRVKSISYPHTGVETFDYTDPVRGMTLDLTRSTDRRGRLTTRHYDANRRMDSITDPENRTTVYGWCTCGALESITDPRGKKTTFVRDLQSRLTSRLFQDNTSISYIYENTTSRLKTIVDPLSQTTNYEYFVDDNLKMVSYANPRQPTPNVNFIYDSNYNRVKTMTDGTGTTNHGYYPVENPPSLGANQLETVDGPLPHDTIAYGYDELGRVINQSIDGTDSTVTYDSLGRLTTNVNQLGQFTRAYEGVTTRLQTLTYPNFQSAHYTYFDNTQDRRLQTLRNVASNSLNLTLSTFDYTYDMGGQILTWTKQLGTTAPSLTGTFVYDLADQLTSAATATVAPPGNYSYGYDLGGNRTSDQVPPGTHTFNDVNQTEDPGYIYDSNGNLTSDGVHDYFWDAANRLIAVQSPLIPIPGVSPSPSPPPVSTVPPGWPDSSAQSSPFPRLTAPPAALGRSEFSYDGLGRRTRIIEKQSGGVDEQGNAVWTTLSDRRYIWNGSILAEERDSMTFFVTKRFFAEGEQINGEDYYFSRDHLGSVREVTDSGGALRAQYEYDPFGKRTKLSGDVDADFGFTGHYHHAPSGLNLALYRAYSAKLGRWISRDPIQEADGVNLYAYVHNNPTNRVDPLGLKAFWHYSRCCNESSGSEWASVVGIGWVLLSPGQCVGVFDGKDCEGMTCGGGFYYVQLDIGTCRTPGCDSWPYTNRRWTNNPATNDPGSMSPTQRGMGGFGDTPPGYQYGPRP